MAVYVKVSISQIYGAKRLRSMRNKILLYVVVNIVSGCSARVINVSLIQGKFAKVRV